MTPTSSPSAPKTIKLAAMKQATMDDFKPLKVWENDQRAIKINEKIINMTAVDNQPLSIVNNQGMIDNLAHLDPKNLILIRKYFNDVMLLSAYQSLRSDIAEIMKKSSYLFFYDKHMD